MKKVKIQDLNRLTVMYVYRPGGIVQNIYVSNSIYTFKFLQKYLICPIAIQSYIDKHTKLNNILNTKLIDIMPISDMVAYYDVDQLRFKPKYIPKMADTISHLYIPQGVQGGERDIGKI